MNEDFEQTLRKINEVAKKDEPNQGELRNVEKGLKNYEVNNLYEFQLEKRMIMDDMHDKLRAIDEGKEVSGFTSGEKRMVGHWKYPVLPKSILVFLSMMMRILLILMIYQQ